MLFYDYNMTIFLPFKCSISQQKFNNLGVSNIKRLHILNDYNYHIIVK